ncbi:hypothetical protein SAMN02745172_00740 [Pseudoxanthobacter soli DSM 19599]|uniref:Uncharacterized protein n=2 Tax=Pseudoxanthobacter TaxID=433838 RepID=A0A1M7Z8W5_9HYPH|nr:hypothetical protein SAMN02745172_00740 [Pseudoxanthobacter soli DSM 19599]
MRFLSYSCVLISAVGVFTSLTGAMAADCTQSGMRLVCKDAFGNIYTVDNNASGSSYFKTNPGGADPSSNSNHAKPKSQPWQQPATPWNPQGMPGNAVALPSWSDGDSLVVRPGNGMPSKGSDPYSYSGAPGLPGVKVKTPPTGGAAKPQAKVPATAKSTNTATAGKSPAAAPKSKPIKPVPAPAPGQQ